MKTAAKRMPSKQRSDKPLAADAERASRRRIARRGLTSDRSATVGPDSPRTTGDYTAKLRKISEIQLKSSGAPLICANWDASRLNDRELLDQCHFQVVDGAGFIFSSRCGD
jgi:hypothetical protein